MSYSYNHSRGKWGVAMALFDVRDLDKSGLVSRT